MKRSVIAAAMLLGSFGYAMADHSKQEVLNGATLLDQQYCSDNISGKKGICQMFGNNGTMYLVFMFENRIEFIREILPEGGYETIYVFGQVNA